MLLPNRLLVVLVLAFACCAPASAQSRSRGVIRADRTNLRAQPSKDAEVLASLPKGEVLEVLGEETPKGQKEAWSRVSLPPSVMVWIYSPGVDKAGVIKAEKLHFRAGPGLNYSVLGTLRKGNSVVIIRDFDNWAQIAPPEGAVAYVASRLLGEPEPVAAATPAPSPAPPVRAPAVIPPPATRPAESAATRPALPTPVVTSTPSTLPPSLPRTTPAPPVVRETPAVTTAPPSPSPAAPIPNSVLPTPTVTPTPVTPAADYTSDITPAPTPLPTEPEPVAKPPLPQIPPGSPRDLAGRRLPAQPSFPVLTSDPDPGRPKPGVTLPEPRQVTREGIVRTTLSIQAPTDYELRNGFYEEGVIDYLFLEPQKDLKKFDRKRVRVQGEEYLDSRWVTPVLKIQSIELVP